MHHADGVVNSPTMRSALERMVCGQPDACGPCVGELANNQPLGGRVAVYVEHPAPPGETNNRSVGSTRASILVIDICRLIFLHEMRIYVLSGRDVCSLDEFRRLWIPPVTWFEACARLEHAMHLVPVRGSAAEESLRAMTCACVGIPGLYRMYRSLSVSEPLRLTSGIEVLSATSLREVACATLQFSVHPPFDALIRGLASEKLNTGTPPTKEVIDVARRDIDSGVASGWQEGDSKRLIDTHQKASEFNCAVKAAWNDDMARQALLRLFHGADVETAGGEQDGAVDVGDIKVDPTDTVIIPLTLETAGICNGTWLERISAIEKRGVCIPVGLVICAYVPCLKEHDGRRLAVVHVGMCPCVADTGGQLWRRTLRDFCEDSGRICPV